MQVQSLNSPLPVQHLEPDDIAGNKHFRVYNFEGSLPMQSELYIPHRKDHYLIVFVRHAEGRQWIDMNPYDMKQNTIYFAAPGQIIVKDGFKKMWCSGIAFTNEFLALQDSATITNLPLILNQHQGQELRLNPADISFVEDMLSKINSEYENKGEWQHRMLNAYKTVFLTYLSRLYTEQYKGEQPSTDQVLFKRFQAEIEKEYLRYHEVTDYASKLNISAGHLSEVVKLQSGRPAIKHIHERLILEARRLLFHTDLSLKTITYDLGFSDPSYFNRFFKRETGQTPLMYITGYTDVH